MIVFEELQDINRRPKPFEFYTAEELWTDEYIAGKMLEFHLDQALDAASRNKKFIDKSVNWIIDRFNLTTGTSVVDFGCGPGLFTLPFAKSGAAVTGIDFSKNSLSYAEKKATENNVVIDYIYGNYLTFKTDRKFDLITMIMWDFTALSPSQRKVLLQIFHSLLKPSGVILLDVYSYNYFHKRAEQAVYGLNFMDRFWSKEEYYGFHNTHKYEAEKLILDKYTIYTSRGKKQIYNWSQCFTKETIAKEFQANSLRIVEFHADVSGAAYSEDNDEFAVIAIKD